MPRFLVDIYEPDVDPGGYQDFFVVSAPTTGEAKQKAIAAAYRRWPSAGSLVAAEEVRPLDYADTQEYV